MGAELWYLRHSEHCVFPVSLCTQYEVCQFIYIYILLFAALIAYLNHTITNLRNVTVNILDLGWSAERKRMVYSLYFMYKVGLGKAA